MPNPLIGGYKNTPLLILYRFGHGYSRILLFHIRAIEGARSTLIEPKQLRVQPF